MKKAIIYSLIFVAIQLVVTEIVAGVTKLMGSHLGSVSTTTWLIVTTAAFSIITIVWFVYAKYAELSPRYLRSGPWAALFFCVLVAIGTVIPSSWLQEQMPALPNLVEAQLSAMMKTPYGLFIVCLLAPFAEELVFRGAVLRSLLAWGSEKAGWLGNHWTAIVISALIFSAVHVNPAQMPHAFLIGLLLGWMYYRTHSIIPGIALHWTNNTIAYVMYNALPDPEAKLTVLFGSQHNVYMALFYSLLIFLPSIYMLNKYLKRAE
jgi:uncharacterized protein